MNEMNDDGDDDQYEELLLLLLHLGMVELGAKHLQIMRNDFTDYARTFWQLCANYAKRF